MGSVCNMEPICWLTQQLLKRVYFQQLSPLAILWICSLLRKELKNLSLLGIFTTKIC